MSSRTSKPRASRKVAAARSLSSPLTWGDLLRHIASKGAVPQTEEWRPFFGTGLTPARIESAVQCANDGLLQDLTDIAQEQLCYDPHLASLLGKRIGRIGTAPWDFTPAQGTGVDKKYALAAAALMRSQFQAVPSLSQAFEDLAWAHWDGRGALENHLERIGYGWRIAEFGWVHPRRLALGKRREIRLVEGYGTFGFESDGIGIEDIWAKFTTLKPRLFNDYPEREGLLRRAIFWSFHKRFAARERAIIIELLRHGRQLLKEKDDNKRQYSETELEAHADRLDGMNTGSTGYIPSGLDYVNTDIDSEATSGHEKMIDSIDRQLSKLVLGGIGTTDEVKGGGLGAKTSETHQEEQQHIYDRDGVRIAERFQLCAVRPMMTLNKQRLGIASDDDVLALAPLLSLRTQKPEDREALLEQAKLFLDCGASVALDELRQRTGFRKPDKDEAILQLTDSPQIEGTVRYIEPRIRVIDPTGTEPGQDAPKAPPPVAPAPATPPAEDDAPTGQPDAAEGAEPEDLAASLDLADDDDWGIYNAPLLRVADELAELRGLVTAADDAATNFPAAGENLRPSLRNTRVPVFPVEEAEALRRDYPEVWKAGGSPLGNLQYRRLAAVARRKGVVRTDTEEESVRLREAWGNGHREAEDIAGVLAQVKWLVIGSLGIDRMRRVIGEAKSRAEMRRTEQVASPVLLARQPSSPNGSPEALIARWRKASAGTFSTWANALVASVSGTTAGEIRKRLRTAAKRLDVDALAENIERAMLHGLMLGATDAHDEMEREAVFEPTRFEGDGERLLLVANFAAKPFQEAIDAFLSKSILPKPLFERLDAKAKRRAFTIAGLARREMLQTAFDAVATSLREGRDLRTFRKDLYARFESAGWVGPSPAHVETIFRNAVMGAYSSGRERQMSQPHVLKARPYWQILGVDDARTRSTHERVHRKVLRADDPAWKKAAPPFGHQCRCRRVSRSEADLKRLGLTVSKGSDVLANLPDPGWDSSLSRL
jgi:SPP1 gp7 family putative phage head morphogenesis protein